MTSILPQPTEKLVAPHGGMNQTWYEKLKKAFTALDSVSSSFDSLGSTGQPLGTAALKDIGTSGNTVPVLDGINAYSKQQTFTLATLTYGATVTWNVNNSQVAVLTLTGNATLSSPINEVAGGTYILIVKQDATGGRTLAFGAQYKWPGGITPTLTPDASAVDVLTFVYDGTSMLGVAAKGFA